MRSARAPVVWRTPLQVHHCAQRPGRPHRAAPAAHRHALPTRPGAYARAATQQRSRPSSTPFRLAAKPRHAQLPLVWACVGIQPCVVGRAGLPGVRLLCARRGRSRWASGTAPRARSCASRRSSARCAARPPAPRATPLPRAERSLPTWPLGPRLVARARARAWLPPPHTRPPNGMCVCVCLCRRGASAPSTASPTTRPGSSRSTPPPSRTWCAQLDTRARPACAPACFSLCWGPRGPWTLLRLASSHAVRALVCGAWCAAQPAGLCLVLHGRVLAAPGHQGLGQVPRPLQHRRAPQPSGQGAQSFLPYPLSSARGR